MFSLLKEIFDDDSFMIVPYLSFANTSEINVRGRIIKDASIIVSEHDGVLDNMANSIKRVFTSKGKNLAIKLTVDGAEYVSKSDDEGYFEFTVPFSGGVIENGAIKWLQGTLSLVGVRDKDNQPIIAPVNIMLAHAKSAFGVITDIDDTIIQSYVNSFLKWRLLYETFLKNASARVAFEHTPEALQALACNGGNEHINPLFYISHSPWNLYDILHRFFHLNAIPDGPLFLRDVGIKRGQALFDYKHHKSIAISKLIEFYDGLPFVMLGDATEHDVDIYLKAYRQWPTRIKTIMIRASRHDKRNQRILAIKRENPDVPLHLIHHAKEIIALCLS